jgi:hypothetical protein
MAVGEPGPVAVLMAMAVLMLVAVLMPVLVIVPVGMIMVVFVVMTMAVFMAVAMVMPVAVVMTMSVVVSVAVFMGMAVIMLVTMVVMMVAARRVTAGGHIAGFPFALAGGLPGFLALEVHRLAGLQYLETVRSFQTQGSADHQNNLFVARTRPQQARRVPNLAHPIDQIAGMGAQVFEPQNSFAAFPQYAAGQIVDHHVISPARPPVKHGGRLLWLTRVTRSGSLRECAISRDHILIKIISRDWNQ